jgi:uncharacterized protein YbgA (DUF1722 family)
MIVLVDNYIHEYNDPILLFFHYMMFISHQIKSFQILSTKDSTIQEYLTSLNVSGDYLHGKAGPKSFRYIIWKGKRYGPAFCANMEKLQDLEITQELNNERVFRRTLSNSSLNSNESNESDDCGFQIDYRKYRFILPIIPLDDINQVRFQKLWTILNNAKLHFKLPHEIINDPVRRLIRILRSGLKHMPKLNDKDIVGDLVWLFDYFIINDEQKKIINELIENYKNNRITIPLVSISNLLVDFQHEILKIKCSRFLKESTPISEFARYCVLIRHNIFATYNGSRKDLILFWNEVWKEWLNSSDEERGKKMIGSVGVHRSWADDDEMRLFIESSDDSGHEIDWFADDSLVLNNGIGQDGGLELIRESESEDLSEFDETLRSKVGTNIERADSKESKKSIVSDETNVYSDETAATIYEHDIRERDLKDINIEIPEKQIDDCVIKSVIDKPTVDRIDFSSHGTGKNNTETKQILGFMEIANENKKELTNIIEGYIINDNELLSHDSKFSIMSQQQEKQIEQLHELDTTAVDDIIDETIEDIELFLPNENLIGHVPGRTMSVSLSQNTKNSEHNEYNEHIEVNSFDSEILKQPGALTAMLDESSSASSSVIQSEGEIDDILLPFLKKVELRKETIPDKIDMFEKLSGHISKHRRNINYALLNDEYETARYDETENVKKILKPAVKRTDNVTVLELKELIENKPELISLKSIKEFETSNNENRASKNMIKKGRSISEIFSALLDDNMKDLSVSAEYKNKIVRPQDLYNRVKIESDKPWDKLSRKTKERYYGAFLRKYDDILNKTDNIKLDLTDVLEIVKVCVEFGDVKHKIVQYAVNVVENQDALSSRQNSYDSIDSDSDNKSDKSFHSKKSYDSIKNMSNNQFVTSINMNRSISGGSIQSFKNIRLSRGSSVSEIIKE